MDMLSVLFVPEVFLVWTSLAKTLGLLAVILGLVSYTVYAERKVCALIQDRVGPNRVGVPLTLLGLKKDLPFLGLVNIGVFFAKICALLLLFIWVRWTLPRFRYDQLMKLGWYFFFELALANIFIAAFVIAYIR